MQRYFENFPNTVYSNTVVKDITKSSSIFSYFYTQLLNQLNYFNDAIFLNILKIDFIH